MPASQTMVVMRHALRLDEVDHDFVSSSKAWWDPPLAQKGFDQMLTARNLNAQDRPLPDGHIQEWMWNGSSIDAALKLAPLSDNFIIDDPDLPAFPETAEQAHARINVALEVEFLYHDCWT
ncbi:MAG: hypothetical protein FRX49_07081 [Trebouxia sp. A1-2]|nr:MAG: hypothetical protein FRX49_07081 [Trebouxia sp. A1-2]